MVRAAKVGVRAAIAPCCTASCLGNQQGMAQHTLPGTASSAAAAANAKTMAGELLPEPHPAPLSAQLCAFRGSPAEEANLLRKLRAQDTGGMVWLVPISSPTIFSSRPSD